MGRSKDIPLSSSVVDAGALHSLVVEDTLRLKGSVECQHKRPCRCIDSRAQVRHRRCMTLQGACALKVALNPNGKSALSAKMTTTTSANYRFPERCLAAILAMAYGIEPIYENDYYDVSTAINGKGDKEGGMPLNNEKEDNWTEDVSGASISLLSPENEIKQFAFATQAQFSEPKPTAAAKINQDRVAWHSRMAIAPGRLCLPHMTVRFTIRTMLLHSRQIMPWSKPSASLLPRCFKICLSLSE